MLSAFGPWCAEACIDDDEDKAEKSHQGFFGKTALSPGITWCNSTTALGLRSLAVETRVGSRCTGKERDTESGLDNFEARYDASSLGRFMTPDPMGGHLENPQSLNKYAYVLNNPTSLTDPTGLDSYLSCTQTKDNASTCQSQTVGYDANGKAQTATVQGVTNADKSFTATQIGNDANGNLVDKTTGTGSYTASANGSGVQFSNNGGQTSSSGVFVNGTPQNTFQDAGFANGGALSGFTFTLTNSKLEAGQTEAGSFTFAGTPDQAGAALQKAGFNPRSGENVGMNEYRSPGSFWTGANSSHFNVFQIGLKPWLSVPQAQGDMHFGEHNPYSPFGWVPHSSEANQ
jgi:RHS repeat-associated protein